MARGEVFASRSIAGHGRNARGCFDEYVISVTLAGTVTYDVDGQPFELNAGDVIIVYPGTSQHWRVDGDEAWDTIYAIFKPRPHWLAWLRMDQQPKGYVRLQVNDPYVLRRVVGCFSRLLRRTRWTVAYRTDYDLNLIEQILLWCRTIHEAQAQPMDERVRAAMAYIAANLDQALSLESIAEGAGSSRSRLASLFREQVGQTPMAYVETQRLERAKQMLRYSAEPIAAIARSVGFDDPHYFSNRFRRHTRTTPRDYRNRVS